MTSKTSANVQLSNSAYDLVKRSTTVLLPAAGTLYASLALIWGLPASEQVVGTIAAVNLFLGVVLSLSTKTYNNSDEKFDGVARITTENDGNAYVGLVMNDIPEAMINKQQVVLKVEDHTDK